jgi:dipeptidyl-peptidase-4
MKRILTSSFFLCAPLFLMAQNGLLTLDESIQGVRNRFAPRTFKSFGWAGADHVFYSDTLQGQSRLWKEKADGTPAGALPMRALNRALKERSLDTLRDFPATLAWTSAERFWMETGGKKVAVSFPSGAIEQVLFSGMPSKTENRDVAPNDSAVAYTRTNNLYLWYKNREWALSNDTNLKVVNGYAAHRNEFGITKGIFWSPNGMALAYYRMDQRAIKGYPIVDWNDVPAAQNPVYYPMAGGPSHQVTLRIYSLESGKTVEVQTGQPADQYLTNVCWSPDAQTIYVTLVNREQDHLWLNAYNARTGALERTLIEEKDDRYVEPLNPPFFLKGDASRFIWQSNRDGFNHLYLYTVRGELVKQLTKGNFEVTRLLETDSKQDAAFFISNADGWMQRHFYKVGLKSGEVVKLSIGKGTHAPRMNSTCTAWWDQVSGIDTPNNLRLFWEGGRKSREVLTAANPLSALRFGPVRFFTLPASDGTPLQCRMYLPLGFDSTKTYPTSVYLYNGPHVQLITDTWLGGASNLWFHYMAQQGYVVFTLDGRGSDNRGKAFEQATFRQLGTMEMQDQMVGVSYLKSKPFVDASRLGIHGWSFGGFMTTTMMSRQPGVFKAGVAGGPVIDWSLYEVMYTERYMDTPQSNPAGYGTANLLNYVQDLKGRLLMIHGTSDDVVVWQHSLIYVKKAVDKGVQLDYFAYPGHLHNVLGKDRTHLFQKITDYFNRNL